MIYLSFSTPNWNKLESIILECILFILQYNKRSEAPTIKTFYSFDEKNCFIFNPFHFNGDHPISFHWAKLGSKFWWFFILYVEQLICHWSVHKLHICQQFHSISNRIRYKARKTWTGFFLKWIWTRLLQHIKKILISMM